MIEQAPSIGKSTMIAALATSQAVTVLLYVVHLFGINDMPPEVATAIVGLAFGAPAYMLHFQQRKREFLAALNSANTGATTP